MKTEKPTPIKEMVTVKKIQELEKRLKDLTSHHNMILDQISALGLDLQMFCRKSKY